MVHPRNLPMRLLVSGNAGASSKTKGSAAMSDSRTGQTAGDRSGTHAAAAADGKERL
jgi:hypothetical protein